MNISFVLFKAGTLHPVGRGVKCSLNIGKGPVQAFCLYYKKCPNYLENAKEFDNATWS